MAKVCISGHYGFGSADKELMLLSIVNILRRQDEKMEIVVFSADPDGTERDLDVTAVGREQWDRIKGELRSADLLLFGGGELLRETADLAQIKYYLKVIRLAQRYKVAVFAFDQMIREYSNGRARAMVAKVMQKVRKITVADRNSADVLHSMGIRRGRLHLQADPLLILGEVENEWRLEKPASEQEAAAGDGAELIAAGGEDAKDHRDVTLEVQVQPKNAPLKNRHTGRPVEIEIHIVDELTAAVSGDTTELFSTADVAAEEKAPEKPAVAAKPAKKTPTRPHDLGAVAPTFWKKPGEKFAAFIFSPKPELPASQITAMADYMVDHGYHVVFLPVDHPDDTRLGKEILRMMKNDGYEVDGRLSPRSLYTAIAAVDFVFTCDLYPMILASLCGKAFASLCAGERERSFVTALGLMPTGDLTNYDSEAFVRNFKAAVADPAAIVAAIEENLGEVQEKAAGNEDQLRRIFAQIARSQARSGRRPAAKSKGATAAAGAGSFVSRIAEVAKSMAQRVTELVKKDKSKGRRDVTDDAAPPAATGAADENVAAVPEAAEPAQPPQTPAEKED